MLAVKSTELNVGEPARQRAGLAIIASLGLVAVFTIVTVVSKETAALDLRQPWRDDPYDVLVSLDFVALPVLVGLGVFRVQLCRRFEPLPARRLLDLLRVARVAVGVTLGTELAEWVSVISRRHRNTWTAATTWQVVALAGLTFATIAACILLRRAAQNVARVATAAAQPDWLADSIVLGLRASRMLGRHAKLTQIAVRWVDMRVIARVRAHPISAAGLLAVLLAAPFIAAKIVLEGYPAPLVLLVATFVTATLFSFVVLVGAYLRVVAPSNARTPGWLSTVLTACIVGAIGFAFHDSLLQNQTVAGLSALYFGAGLTGATVSLVGHALWRRTANRTRPGRSR